MTPEEKTRNLFFTAVILDDLPTVQDMLSEYPDAVGWLSPAEYPPLHLAILNHKPAVAACLAEYGADLGQVAHGESAAELAGRKGMLEALQDASARQQQRRDKEIETHVHGGLKKDIPVSRPLAFRPKP